MKRTTVRFVAFFPLCLLLFILTVPAMAWDWPCPDECYDWNGYDCILIGECGVADPCPGECCDCIDCECVGDDSNCGNCQVCQNCNCVKDPTVECDDSSDCKTCYYCMPNCKCELPYGSECGEDDPCPGECHTCVGSEVCLCEDDDSKCASDECCLDGTCVPKCTNTGQCSYEPPDTSNYVTCENFNPTDKRCEDIIEGALCGHVIKVALNDAECAACAPDCYKEYICPCAEIIPVYCKTRCYLLVCACLCNDAHENEATYSGAHYECAD